MLIQSPKREPLVSNTRLIQSAKGELLVSNIGLIQSAKGEPLVSNIGLIQSRKGEPLVSNIGLIQSRKGEPLVSNIGLIQSPKGEPLVSNIVYYTNSESKNRAARKQYNNHPGRNKAAACVRRSLNRDSICAQKRAQKRAKYALGEPKLDVKDMYVKEILSHLLADAEARSLVSDSFPKMHINNKINVSVKAMCRVAAKKLLNKAL